MLTHVFGTKEILFPCFLFFGGGGRGNILHTRRFFSAGTPISEEMPQL